MTKLTISERIVLHLSRYDLQNDDLYNIPWDLTQDGIASSLRISRAHSSIELKKLRANGKVVERQTHIKGGGVKRKSYMLTPAGMEEAKRLKSVAEKEGIDIMPMLDMKRCDPKTLWDSVNEEDRDALGIACVLRRSVPRTVLPETSKPVIPVDVNGMTVLSALVKDNVLSVASDEQKRNWHSIAADHWLDMGEPKERLYHLIKAGRVKDACRLIVSEKERLLYEMNNDLYKILSLIDSVPEKYFIDVMPVKITAAIVADDLRSSEKMISLLKETDMELGLLYSADLEIKKGNHSDALSIMRSIGSAGIEAELRMAGVLGSLGNRKEAMSLLESMKNEVIRSGTVDNLDRIYIQMADISAASGDHDSSVKYLTKALGVTGDIGKRRTYALLASSYGALGMTDKSKECLARAK